MTKLNKMNQRMVGKKINPMIRAPPRRKAPTVKFDGTRLNAQWYAPSTTALLNIATDLFYATAENFSATVGSQNASSVGFVTSAISNAYQEYRYNSTKVKWLPTVGPGVNGAGSRVTIAYFDNPEVIATLALATSTTLLAAVKGARNAESWNAWETYTYNVPLTYRRPWFDVNTNFPAHTVDPNDRAVQGLIVAVTESVNATELLGQFHLTYDLTLKGFSTATST